MKIIYTTILALLVNFTTYSQTKITEILHQNRPHFKIETPKVTYVFDKEGGGFSSIIDKDGLDWISFNEDSTVATYPKSGGGWYRGLPNAVFGNEDGGMGHPGHHKASSVMVNKNTISTKSNSGLWEWNYVFYDDYVVWNVTKTDPNYFYWLLYEGTIAGSWNSLENKYWGTDKLKNGPIKDFYKNESTSELMNWVFFGDKSVNRVLYIVQKNKDEIYDMAGFLGDNKNGMELSKSGMIVAGIGRDKRGKPAMNTANSFIIGLAEIKANTEKGYKKLSKKINKLQF